MKLEGKTEEGKNVKMVASFSLPVSAASAASIASVIANLALPI